MKDETTIRPILTPEGVPIPFQVALAGERIAAFAIDALLIILGASALGLIAALAMLTGGTAKLTSVALAVLFIGWFVLISLYFVVFELLWAGQTPGKRKVGLRVIAREGGPVSGEALLARNLTRELEVFLPIGLIANPAIAAGGAPEWTGWLAGAWVFALVLLPLCNRDRLRLGDLVGGTIVVREPRVVLLPDLAASPVILPESAPGALDETSRYAFSEEQLASYGIYELQVLEAVLQRAEGDGAAVLSAVAERIARRIGWDEPLRGDDAEPFLRAFYRAQRGRLERRMLFGERKERKS